MDCLKRFYGNASELRITLIKGLQKQLHERKIPADDVDEICELKAGTWAEIAKDPSNLTRELFYDICFSLELDIEDAMPLNATPEDLTEVAHYMEKNNHGMVAFTGTGDPNDSEESKSDSSENPPPAIAGSFGVSYEDQASLYIRLRTLDSLDSEDLTHEPNKLHKV